MVRYTDKGLKIQSDIPVTCNVDGEMLTDTEFKNQNREKCNKSL